MSGVAAPNPDKAMTRELGFAVERSGLAKKALERINNSFEFIEGASRANTVPQLVQTCLAQLLVSSESIEPSTLITALRVRGLKLKEAEVYYANMEDFWAALEGEDSPSTSGSSPRTPTAENASNVSRLNESLGDKITRTLNDLCGENSYDQISITKDNVNYREYTIGDVKLGVPDIRQGGTFRAYVIRGTSQSAYSQKIGHLFAERSATPG